ncbi:hypothetical protein [Xanthomonas arboricola]|uniref:hypothetical protein n=1 Tax=Xanthomonas arboricola TaxID=56448 RepID=UPI000E1E39D3|nr:hypothetical protein [Xanthomonas arboricola]
MVKPSRFQNRAVQIVARLQLPGNSSEDSNFPVLVGIRPAGGLDLQHLAGAADVAATAGRRQQTVIKVRATAAKPMRSPRGQADVGDRRHHSHRTVRAAARHRSDGCDARAFFGKHLALDAVA